MSMEIIRQRLVDTIADIDLMLAPPQAPVTELLVQPGENLWSLIETRPDIVTFTLADEYRWDGARDVRLTRPVTIRGTQPPWPVLSLDTLRPAPGSTLTGLRVMGQNPNGTIIVAAQGLTLDDCQIFGPARRGVEVNCADVSILRTTIADCYHTEDAQAIAGWSGTRNLRVSGCTFEASGEVILFGGADPFDEALIPTDIVIEGCILRKPLAWRGVAGRTAKNLFELKNARHVTMRGCELSHSWAGGQTGFAIVLTVRNQDGRAPFSTIEHVIIEQCTVTGCGSGIQILGRDDRYPSGVMRDVVIRRNDFADINPSTWGGAGKQVFISGGPRQLTIANNEFAGENLNTFLSFDQPQHTCEGLIVQDNVFVEGQYGIHGTNAPGLGTPTLAFYAPGYVFAGNTVRGAGAAGRWISYPAGTVRA